MSHRNEGRAWGRVLKMDHQSTKSGKPETKLTILCTPSFGPTVTVYAKLYKESEIELLKALYAKDPHQTLKFSGGLSQYTMREKLYTAFTFFNVLPEGGAEQRASFILRGRLIGKEYPTAQAMDEHTILRIEIKSGQRKTRFGVYAKSLDAEAVRAEDEIEVKGYINRIEDSYGSHIFTGPICNEVIKAETAPQTTEAGE